MAFEMPNRAATSFEDSVPSSSSALAARASLPARLRGRPPFLPFLRASARPATVRSRNQGSLKFSDSAEHVENEHASG